MNILCFRGEYRCFQAEHFCLYQKYYYLLNIFDLQDDVDLINYMYDYENIVKAGTSLYRNSNCTGRLNTYGHMLLDFCRKNNIYIVNGRVGKDKLIGECTCQDVSMIDYFLSSSKLFFIY
jgi:hypothetical protein